MYLTKFKKYIGNGWVNKIRYLSSLLYKRNIVYNIVSRIANVENKHTFKIAQLIYKEKSLKSKYLLLKNSQPLPFHFAL